jgi:hypothetical protein
MPSKMAAEQAASFPRYKPADHIRLHSIYLKVLHERHIMKFLIV